MVSRTEWVTGPCNNVPPRLRGADGRPWIMGKRLASPSEMLTDPATPWKCVTVTGSYRGDVRIAEISTATAVWRDSGIPVVPIRWAKQPKVPRA